MADDRLSHSVSRVTVTCPIHNIAKLNTIRPNGCMKRVCRLCAAERLRRHRARKVRRPDDPMKTAARKAVENALRDGRLVRKACDKCGASRAHAHHEDYSKPLDVMWLCPKHHKARHRELLKKEKAASPVKERRPS